VNPPLAVIRYLAELDAALAARGAPDRDQIVTQVGEHITQALGDVPNRSDAEINTEIAAVLADLGDPLRIADEAAPRASEPSGNPAAPSATPVAYLPVPPKPALLTRSWIPAVALGLWAVGAAGVAAPLLLLAVSSGDGIPGATLLLGVVLNVPLVASAVLVCCSPLFRLLGRWIWLLCVPVALFAESVTVHSGVQHSPYPLDAAIAWTVILACPILTIYAVVMITIRAYRRTQNLPAPVPPPLAQPATP